MIESGFAIAITVLAGLASAQAAEPVIEISDVERFYEIYDAADGHPDAETLQRYIDNGSAGLRTFADLRRTTGARIAAAIEKNPKLYANARQCADVLPRVRLRLAAALDTLGELYPDARFPPVTVAIGRGKPVGVGGPKTGVQIGLEALCAVEYFNADIEDRFVYVTAHEFIHVQQAPLFDEEDEPTVLEVSLQEGVAEFVTELITGGISYSHLPALVAGREKEIEKAFDADKHKTDLSDWVHNGTLEKPGDLGYWVGYRIAKSYYQHGADKNQALREILQAKDAEAFLAASGWYPGIRLDDTVGH